MSITNDMLTLGDLKVKINEMLESHNIYYAKLVPRPELRKMLTLYESICIDVINALDENIKLMEDSNNEKVSSEPEAVH